MTATAVSTREQDSLADVRIIDCDSHLTEPPDLWSSRVGPEYRDKIPVQQTVDGHTGWYLHDRLWASTGGNTIAQGPAKRLGTHLVQPFSDIDPSAWSVKERLAVIDELGIWAQILYPNGIGFASNHLFAIEDEAERTLILQVYNDFLMDTQLESGGRLLPQGVVPFWDMDLTVKEMTRLIDKGMRGFTLSDKPEMIGLPELVDPYFDPMWDLFAESGTVANFHIGAGNRREDMESLRSGSPAKLSRTDGAPIPYPVWDVFGRQRRLAVGAAQLYMSNVRIIVNLCMSDIFDRFPKLKIVSAESGIGWVPFILEAMEYQLDEMVTDPDEVGLQKLRPAEYFREHMYVMYWFEKVGAEKLIEDIGVGNVLVETDFPHPTCLYPNPREHFAKVMSELSPEIQRRVLQDNAAELYKLELPST
ncbi:amidohydrolase [Acidiferrimicrobium sp. IK]|uniref:amidohydrolase family protein n=1 Tax=Acidiferrimicrobium sp. IK TaxID=2871700 RepID=UPI0021CB27F9|nr:amidohydrolase [Acidiferrimicrobium sp. IK]MCU4183833.1 amidohydrolase [Acidiferrimicrobium sp. IK]